MTILYIHGVKVRSEDHGRSLEKPFRRWLAAKFPAPADVLYEPVYWGDLASDFRWKLASRPRTQLTGMGGGGDQLPVASLRGVSDRATLERPQERTADPAVLDLPPAAAPAAAVDLQQIPRERRPDFLADLYLSAQQANEGEDVLVERPDLGALAAAAAETAEAWEALVTAAPDSTQAANALLQDVENRLHPGLHAMGGIGNVGELLRRALSWPADAVSTLAAEVRPVANEFIANFVGDVFVYLVDREGPGRISKRVLDALERAQARKAETGEPIVVVTHSMGGQLFYDAVTALAETRPALAGLEIDHWFSCGAQVSLFAELRLFRDQPDVRAPQKLARPARVKRWTNYYDGNDLVGFVMEPVFNGVTDLTYDTGYGLAFAHTGFLARPSFFQAMARALP